MKDDKGHYFKSWSSLDLLHSMRACASELKIQLISRSDVFCDEWYLTSYIFINSKKCLKLSKFSGLSSILFLTDKLGNPNLCLLLHSFFTTETYLLILVELLLT